MVPYSDLGKIMTIIYAIPTIALGMSLYLSAGHIVTAFTQTTVLLFYNEYLGKKLERKSFSIQVMTVQTILTLMVWMIFSLVSMYSANQEIDRFIDGVYFAFLTISTVGFGDFSYSSERAFNTNPLIWVIHAVLFCVGTGAIASIIGSINELIANGNIKIPSCLRQNKKEVLGLKQMFKRSQSEFMSIALHKTESIEANKQNGDSISRELTLDVIPKDRNDKEENSNINQPSDLGMLNQTFVDEQINHSVNNKDKTDQNNNDPADSHLHSCLCQDKTSVSLQQQTKTENISVATQTDPSEHDTSLHNNHGSKKNCENKRILIKTSLPKLIKCCDKTTEELNNIEHSSTNDSAEKSYNSPVK